MRFTISSIELNNFRQYHGSQTINLEYNKNKNVAIICGRNGAGKSNLLNALTWCFYGIETHTDSEDNKKMPIINTTALSDLTPNCRVQTEVKVYLDTDRGAWIIKRSISGGKRADGSQYVDQDSVLSVTHPVGGQDKVETGSDTEVLINNLLPKDLRSFFFMDGEKLREFFNKDTARNIGDSIEKVSQLDLMYKAAEHLETLEKDLRKNVKDSTPQLDEIHTKIQYLEKNIEDFKTKNKKYKDDVRKDNDDLKAVKDFLKNCGIENVERLENERQGLEQDTKNLSGRLQTKEQERNRYLARIAPFIYLKTPLEETQRMLLEKVAKGDLPPKIKKPFVRELIDGGYCICGTRIEGDAKQKLEDYCKTLDLSEVGEVSIIGKTKIRDILDEIGRFGGRMDEFHNEIQSFENELLSKRRRMEQITNELKQGEDKEKIINYEHRRDELIKNIGWAEKEIKLNEAELKRANDLLDKERSEYQKELGATTRNEQLKKKLQIVKDALKTIAGTEATIKNKLRNQIQNDTEQNFFKLIRKTGAFKKIVIKENYEVVVEHSSGWNAIDHISAGEYMILGLSFMSALMNISGFKAPVIIDTPLGKIDDKHRNKITTELPIFLEGTQLILFVTPTEYDEQVKINLSKHLLKGNFYDISENTTQEESKVVPHA